MDLRIGGEDDARSSSSRSRPTARPAAPSRRSATCPAAGIRLRTRALTTTMFARFLLGDLFVHGIGGAKYDELGDEIARGFFGDRARPASSPSR